MGNWKVRCGGKKHGGWQDSKDEAETERKGGERGRGVGCGMLPTESERVLGWRGMRAGEIPPEFRAGGCTEGKGYRDVNGGGWGRSEDADGQRRAESRGCRPTAFHDPVLLPYRVPALTLPPGARAPALGAVPDVRCRRRHFPRVPCSASLCQPPH